MRQQSVQRLPPSHSSFAKFSRWKESVTRMRNSSFSAPRHGVTGAIFMIGLAFLFATDWLWPGILVLVGVTSLVGAFLGHSEPKDDDIPLRVNEPEGEKELAAVRYPAQCASCGAATPEEPRDSGALDPNAACEFCGSPLVNEQ